MKTRQFLLLLAALPLTLHAGSAAFTYQGRLMVNGSPANGCYDLQFALFDAGANGSQIGLSVTNLATGVTNGLFAATLDFGSVFGAGDYWLQISVETNGIGPYTPLSPRQELLPVPLAAYAAGAGSVAATGLTGPVTDAQLPPDLLTNVANLLQQNAALFQQITNLSQQITNPPAHASITIPAGHARTAGDALAVVALNPRWNGFRTDEAEKSN